MPTAMPAARRSRAQAQARGRFKSPLFVVGAVVVVAGAALVGLFLQRAQPPAQSAQPPAAPAAGGGLQQLGSILAADYHSLAFSAKDPSVLYFGHHNGVMQSADGGRSWTPAVSRQ